MDSDEFLDRLRSQSGVTTAIGMPDDLFSEIVDEESTVSCVGGALPVTNLGLEDCGMRKSRFCIFYHHGEFGTTTHWDRGSRALEMRDSEGTVVGFDIPPEDHDSWAGRDDIVFLSDDFVLLMGRRPAGSSHMVVLSRPYVGEGQWVPEDLNAVVWFPCTTSADIIGRRFGVDMTVNSVGIVAVDL